jgi:hypothetical protein
MRHWLLAGFAMLLLCGPTLAQVKHDGNELSDECTVALRSIEHPTNMDGFNTGACFGLVDGIMETMQLWNTVDSQHNEARYHGCIPNEVTVGEAVKVVLKYLNDNPTQLHWRDTHLIAAALSKGYPCPAPVH